MVTFDPGVTREQKIAILAGGDQFYSREGGLFSTLSDEFLDALGSIHLDPVTVFDPEMLQRVLMVWEDEDALLRRLQEHADPNSPVAWGLIVEVSQDVARETSLQCMVPPDLVDQRLSEAIR